MSLLLVTNETDNKKKALNLQWIGTISREIETRNAQKYERTSYIDA